MSKQYTITSFNTNKDIFGKVSTLTFDSIVRGMLKYYEISKEYKLTKEPNKQGLIKLKALGSAVFKDGKRETAAIIRHEIAFLDIDHFRGTIDELQYIAHQNFQYYEYFLYTTASHSETKTKARIVFPLHQPLLASQYKNALWNFVESLGLENICGKESSTPAQIMFLPFYQEGQPFYHFYNEAEEQLDLLQYYKETANLAQTNFTYSQDIEQIRKKLESFDCTEVFSDYTTWVKFGMALHHATNASKEGLKLWIDMSYKDENYAAHTRYKKSIKEECERRYNDFKISPNVPPITLGSFIEKKQEIQVVEQPQKYNSNQVLQPVPTSLFVHFKRTTGKKEPPPNTTFDNYLIMLDYYNIRIKLDVIKRKMILVKDNKDITDAPANDHLKRMQELDISVSNADEQASCEYLLNEGLVHQYLSNIFAINEFSSRNIIEWTRQIAWNNQINTWRDHILSRSWDGVDRLRAIQDTIIVDDEHKQIRDIYIKKWLLQMIAVSCCNTRYEQREARYMLLFQGGEGKGKTAWVKKLEPAGLKDFVRVNANIDFSSDTQKFSILNRVIVELGEFDGTLTKNDLQKIKAFLSATEDVIRTLYVMLADTYPRTTCFIGTVNNPYFLSNYEENTRFLTLPIIECNHEHNIDLQQLYRQLYEMYKAGESYFLTSQEREMHTKLTARFLKDDILEQKFRAIYDVESGIFTHKVYLDEILFTLGVHQADKRDKIEVKNLLRKYKIFADSNGRYSIYRQRYI